MQRYKFFIFALMSITYILILVLIGLFAGLLSGIVGIGGGLVIIPLLIILLGYSQHEAQGTSLAVMLPPIGILAAMNYHHQGFVKCHHALIISSMFILGGYIGSRYAVNLRPDILRRIFGLIMLFGALKMILSK